MIFDAQDTAEMREAVDNLSIDVRWFDPDAWDVFGESVAMNHPVFAVFTPEVREMIARNATLHRRLRRIGS